ncbi:MAG TPA: ABC transporter permease [Myxococcaceae bacterium]|nr:ABC transporter permease [Myxococcaceae bacterium]
MDALRADLRDAFRSLLKAPLFALAAVLSVALAIGADTSVFSIVDSVLLRPLPYGRPERLTALPGIFSYPQLEDLRAQTRTLEHLGGYGYVPFDLTGDGDPVQIPAAVVTGDLFGTLGVPAALGRTLVPSDDLPGAAPAVVVSDAFWRSRMGADPSPLGRALMLSGRSYTVIGVMPPGFVLPTGMSELWVPVQLAYPEAVNVRAARFMRLVARRGPGIGLGELAAELGGIAARMREQYPTDLVLTDLRAVPLQTEITGEVRPGLLLLLGAVTLVLLVACANFAHLLLARGAARRSELAVRAALGADRRRLVRQLLTESTLIAVVGGLLGTALAFGAVPALVALAPGTPLAMPIRIDARVLGVALALSLLTGTGAGLVPALGSSRLDLHASLSSATEAPAGARARSFLVVAELVLTLLLLCAAGLLLRSFARLESVGLGFDTTRVFTAGLDLPPSRYTTTEEEVRVRNRILDELRARPGIEVAGLVTSLPLSAGGYAHEVLVEGEPPPVQGSEPMVETRFASHGFFEALRIPVMEGRLMDDGDTAARAQVVVVNASFVRRHLGKRFPLGVRIRWAREDEVRWMSIVGVVGDVADRIVDREPRPTIYVPFQQEVLAFKRWSTLVVRSRTDDARVPADAIRGAVHAADPLLAVTRLRWMDDALAGTLAQRRFILTVLSLFAGAALLLGGLGVYSVVSYSVTRRTREIGIRMALGARRERVVRMVLSQGARLALIALAVGVPVSLATNHLLRTMLYGIGATDAPTYLGTAAGILALALTASWLPARRAAHTDPLLALRAE